MKKLNLEVDGKTLSGEAVLSREGVLWVHLNGQTFSLVNSARRQFGEKAKAVVDPLQVIAPMPGKIIKLTVRENEQVSVGQVLVIMEAMKMEYTIKAASPATVAEVLCAVGDQVELGRQLLRLRDHLTDKSVKK